MEAKKIVFPTDFSHASDAGLSYATSIARDKGARMIVVHVEEPPIVYGSGELYYGMPEPDTDALKKMLEAVVPTDTSVSCVHRLLSGDPATEIVRLAEEEGAEVIVMGTHGRTGLKRLLMGSVAEAIVRRATCPVFTYKEPHAEKSDSQ